MNTGPIRLLHLEDSANDAELIKAALTKQNLVFDIVLVQDGKTFEAALKKGPWDIILCDYKLPSYDGITAVATVKKLCPDTPIIMVSGTIGEELAVQILQLGANDYILKNSLTRLYSAVERCLREQDAYLAAKQLKAKHDVAQEYFKVILDAFPMVSYACNSLTFEVSWLSDSVQRVTGFSVEQFKKDPLFWPSHIHPDDQEQVIAAFSNPKDGDKISCEYRWQGADNKYLWFYDTANVIKKSDQELLIVGAWIDITERKNLENQFNQAQKLEALGQLAGGIAHDFNNLLTVILAVSSDLLESYSENSDITEKATLLVDTGMRAAALTKRLLSFSRQETIKPEILALDQVVPEIMQMLERVIGEQYKLNFISQRTAAIKIDKGQIGQILLNLAINAKDAMPNGGTITLEVSDCYLDQSYTKTHIGAKEGPHVMLSVSDSGTGIDPAIMTKIFDPFFTTKEVGRGTGLGLSMVLAAVKQNNGSLEVFSEPGKGTSFKLYFPQVVEDATINKVVKAPVPLSIGNSTCDILLVDDEPEIRKIVSSMLQSKGFSVTEACDGEDALKKCQEEGLKIDILLTDVIMPNMGGLELQAALKTKYPNMKAVFMSGYIPDATVNKPSLGENVAYLAKPFDKATLFKIIQEVLS